MCNVIIVIIIIIIIIINNYISQRHPAANLQNACTILRKWAKMFTGTLSEVLY